MKYVLIPGLLCAIVTCGLHLLMTCQRVRGRDTTDATLFLGGVAATGLLACGIVVMLMVKP